MNTWLTWLLHSTSIMICSKEMVKIWLLMQLYMHITLFITSLYTYSKIHCICPCIHLGCVNWTCSNLCPFADSPRCSARSDKVVGEAKGEPLRWNIKISWTSSHRGKLWNLPPNHWLDWDVISSPNFPDLVVVKPQEVWVRCGCNADEMPMICTSHVTCFL